jgi:hypothetical protein
MRSFLVLALLCMASCQGKPHPDGTSLATSFVLRDPVVCRIESPQISGSLIPLGNQRAITALHVFKQPVAWIDGTLSGLDLEASGGRADVSCSDWAIVRVNNTQLPEPDLLERNYQFREGEEVFITGFATASSRHNTDGKLTPQRFAGRVSSPPFWAEVPEVVVTLHLEGAPDLSGASGGPVSIKVNGVWRVVGIYLGRWESGLWTGYVVRPLPDEVFAP